jgi:hypothetical protein
MRIYLLLVAAIATVAAPLQALHSGNDGAVLDAASGGGGGGAESITVVTPTFQIAPAPAGVAESAGEPGIGVNWATGMVMFQSFQNTYRVNFAANPVTWTLAKPLWSLTNLDPVLFTDSQTGRTFAGGLSGTCSLMGYSDNDGALWVPVADACANPGWDHPTIGGGPWAAPLVSAPYTHSVYYCSQTGLTPGPAWCAVSPDGGLTFDPAVPAWTTQCGGLHGHVKIAPDGTAYVPNANCGGQQGVAVSTNNGLTWTVRKIPGSTTQSESDPSVAIGAGGKVYYCYQSGDGHPVAATSSDRGATWSAKVDIGTAFGIQNIQFPAAVAGDNDRAACAFLGTPTGGNDQAAGFAGAWHLYVAFTFDGGATWTTVDATPNDPVQRGCIWLGGGGNACRNLLDFMDAQIGSDGRVFVGFADGCTSAACIAGTPGQFAEKGTIARQNGGTTLFAAFGG